MLYQFVGHVTFKTIWVDIVPTFIDRNLRFRKSCGRHEWLLWGRFTLVSVGDFEV